MNPQNTRNTENPYHSTLCALQKTRDVTGFVDFVWEFYSRHHRYFAWRQNPTPYNVIVSEIMLQQTQTYRVAPKFETFIQTFPDFNTLAQSSLAAVITLWKGLGYNRRAQSLHNLAQNIVRDYNGVVPHDPALLKTLPGIGASTAASVATFAYNTPNIFIETNIRSVFLHIFFSEQHENPHANKVDTTLKSASLKIHDRQIVPLLTQALHYACAIKKIAAGNNLTTLPHDPRNWYYALMDLGVFIKQHYKNPNIHSKHYTKQSRFIGSNRQIRGQILEILIRNSACTRQHLYAAVLTINQTNPTTKRIYTVIQELLTQKLIQKTNNKFHL